MHDAPMDVSYLGETTFHRKFVRFGIRQADRLSHLYILGKTGVGKSTLLETLASGDLQAGRGFALIDPHGDLAERIRDAAKQVGRPFIYMDAADRHQPYGFNPLRRVREDKIPLAVSGLLDAMKKLWPDAWDVRMEHVLRQSLYALMERDGSTLPDILRLYTDKEFRRGVVKGLRHDMVRRFWRDEFEKYPDRQRAEAVAPIQDKLGGFPHFGNRHVRPAAQAHLSTLATDGKTQNPFPGFFVTLHQPQALTIGMLPRPKVLCP